MLMGAHAMCRVINLEYIYFLGKESWRRRIAAVQSGLLLHTAHVIVWATITAANDSMPRGASTELSTHSTWQCHSLIMVTFH